MKNINEVQKEINDLLKDIKLTQQKLNAQLGLLKSLVELKKTLKCDIEKRKENK